VLTDEGSPGGEKRPEVGKAVILLMTKQSRAGGSQSHSWGKDAKSRDTPLLYSSVIG
jgi:hypothetical protein